MSRSRCEKEMAAVSAVRTGTLTLELRAHLQICADCAEATQVARTLLRYAATLDEEQRPMDADRIWRRARAQKEEIALKRATRPLIFMRGLSGGGMIALVAWLLHRYWTWNYQELTPRWKGDSAVVSLIGVVIALLCAASGALYLLYEDKRKDDVVSLM